MKRTLALPLLAMMIVSLTGTMAFANLGVNITIYDEFSTLPPYGPTEDQEVEPGTIPGQPWDMEAFCLDLTGPIVLSAISGWDPVNGNGYPQSDFPGDLFIDIDGDAQYGRMGHMNPNEPYPPSTPQTDLWGYDFAVVLDFDTLTYQAIDLHMLGQVPVLLRTVVPQGNIWSSNPLEYVQGGVVVANGNIDYQAGLADGDPLIASYGVTGGLHNVTGIDLDWLALGYQPEQATFHWTMGCGNDDLMGHYPVPEPATLSLLGLGLLGAVLRKRFWA